MIQDHRLQWIKSPKNLTTRASYVKAKVLRPLSQKELEVELQTDRGPVKMTVPIDCSFDAAQQKNYEDMCEMDILNQPEVLFNLIRRYQRDDIFTNIGATLIAINPYRKIQRLFNSKELQNAKKLTIAGRIAESSSHVYKFAGRAFQAMKTNGGKQALVISGESGAGKTQSTKYCLQLLTSLSEKKTQSIEQKILAANPILQAFGNSKTVRNQNSSRFGKYMKIYFEGEHILGAQIQSYLLQKSRVVNISPNQRSFHAFYALTCSGQFQAMDSQKYLLLRQSGCYTSNHGDDRKYFDQINLAFRQIGFKQVDVNRIWLILLVILEMGNIEFDQTSNLSNQSRPCELRGSSKLQKIAGILQIEEKKMQRLLLYQRRKFLKEYTYIPYSKTNAKANRQAFCKALYESLFEFILKEIQAGIKPTSFVDSRKQINILDIFGFQKFTQNSFEQFCINYANQRLLRLYNNYVFEKQIQMLRQDGLQQHIGGLVAPSNQDLINLINSKLSLFSIINDMSIVQFTDQDIMNGFRKLQSPHITFDKIKSELFTLSHSPSKVEYSILGFKSKNQDKVNEEIGQLIGNLWGETRKEAAGKTILSKFNKQIEDLMAQLQSSKVHFMRCIKPNEFKRPNEPDDQYILTQIRYLGVLQTIFIRKNTFPARKTYEQFRRQYDLVFSCLRKQISDKLAAQEVLKKYSNKKGDYLLGNWRVYMTSQVEDQLIKQFYKCIKVREQKVRILQRATKVWLYRIKVLRNLKIFIKRLNDLKLVMNKLRIKIKKHGFQGLKQYDKAQLIKIKQKKQQLRMMAFKQAKRIRQQEESRNKQQMLQKSALVSHSSSANNESSFQKSSEDFSVLKDGYKIPFSQAKIIPKSYGLSLMLNQTDMVSENAIEPRSAYTKPETPSNELMGKAITLNQQYLNVLNQSSSCLTQNSSAVFEGQFDVGQFDGPIQKLQKLKNILSENYKFEIQGNEEDIFSPISSHYKFKINQLSQQFLNKLLQFPVEGYLKGILRKRTTFFGFEKTYQQILVFKPASLSKSMTVLTNQQDGRKAIAIFNIILKIGQQLKIQKVLTLIEQFLNLCQSITYNLKIQVMIQLLRQSSSKSELVAIRIYQTMVAFIHVFNPIEEIIKVSLNIFYKKLKDKNLGTIQRQYLLYLFSCLVKKLQNKSSVGYMPISYQIMGLICRRQISVPVFLTTGNSVFINAQSYNTFGDLKAQCLQKFFISDRWDSSLFGFFEVIHFDDQDIEESPIRQTNIVWDMITYWQLTKQKYSQSGINPPIFFLVFKLRYAITVRQGDEQCTQLCYSQIYFEFFMGRIRLEPSLMFQLGAHVFLIKYSEKNIQDIIVGLLPIYFSKQFNMQASTSALKTACKQIQAQKATKIQMKYNFIKICSQFPLTMGFNIPTQEQQPLLYLKPRFLYIVNNTNNKSEIITISLKKLIKWQIQKQYFCFEVAGGFNQQNKVYKIITECSSICNEYFQGLSAVKLGKNSQKFPSFKKK